MSIVLTNIHYFQELEKIRKSVLKEPALCMLCPNCEQQTINSHVFQKNGILSAIASKNKIYQFHYNSLFNSEKIGYKYKGINEAFTFKGFCSTHDNAIFSPIEPSKGEVDWNNTQAQFLLGYRSLGREIYINIAVCRICSLMIDGFEYSNQNDKISLFCLRSNTNATLKNLMYYKQFLEMGVFKDDFSMYNFDTIVLPFQLELCLSAPILVKDPRGHCFGPDYQELNIVNIFPYKGNTIIILGYSNKFENIWQKRISDGLKSNDPKMISTSIQDIVFRAEFHCISKKLHDSISYDIPSFLSEWYDKIEDFDLNLNVKSNIFYKPICELINSYDSTK